jgi:hypothetical protein
MNNAIKVLLQMQNGFLQLESTLDGAGVVVVADVSRVDESLDVDGLFRL